jgi:dTDP-4-amino-4,6-dideoxygalactose transaminase
MSNFGFSAPRTIVVPGTNGKMSEYAAAVGLAALDLWPQKREVWLRLKMHYMEAMKQAGKEAITSPWLSEEWVSSTCNVRLPISQVEPVIQALAERGVESRQWWVKGCHRQEAYEKFPHGKLTVTEALADSVIALPFSIDLKKKEIDQVVGALVEVMALRRTGKSASA